jgi:glycosyltransferase involved in cell wall biosynthesis
VNLLSFEVSQNWSWSLTASYLFSRLPGWSIRRKFQLTEQHEEWADVIFCQHVVNAHDISVRQKVVARLGGARSFHGKEDTFDGIMKDVYAVVATNEELAAVARRVCPRVTVIPNGLDLDIWKPEHARPKEFAVGFCGNIAAPGYRHYKGFGLVEWVCADLGVPLVTALYGEKRIPYERMIPDFYEHVSCILHPTAGEGCSNTIMEALALGIPVVTTRAAGFHGERLTDGENVLFCERSTESIARAVAMLRDDSVLRTRLSRNGRRFAEQHHEAGAIAARYAEIFHACGRGHRGRKIAREIIQEMEDRRNGNGHNHAGEHIVLHNVSRAEVQYLVDTAEAQEESPVHDEVCA